MKSRLWLSLTVLVTVWASASFAASLPTNNDKVAFDQELNTITDDAADVDAHNGGLPKDILKMPLADDPRFNKMLPKSRPAQRPVTAHKEVSTSTVAGTIALDISHADIKKTANETTEDDYEYDDYYLYDEDNSTSVEGADDDNSSADKIKLTPIKASTDSSVSSPVTTNRAPTTTTPTATPSRKSTSAAVKQVVSHNNLDTDDDDENIPEDEYVDDDDLDEDPDYKPDDDDEGLDDDEDEADEARDDYAKPTKLPCPRDCICRRNKDDYQVATCSRLDVEVQNFGGDITDLEVVDVGPKHPIFLGENFFKRIGLERVITIKITNCTIENVSPTAFHGLKQLFSVNLTNTGLDMVHPDTFAENTRLRLLSLAGNDLSAMQAPQSPYSKYMLNAPSVEELNLARCNLKQLLPTAFDMLKNIVYINLAENGIKTLPATLFNQVETIEELDLSFNSIRRLPKAIFSRTSLAMLHLKYNLIANETDFLTGDLQKLDLSYCKITEVNGKMFKNLEGLQSLQLKGNGIKRIHHAAFLSLRHLRHIDLSYNDLKEVSALLFLKNKDLDVIKLNDNPGLKQLPSEGFECESGAFFVYHLDVSNCDINVLGDNTFSSMPHLKRLNLAWNNLKTISKNVLSPLKNLKDLDLSNNLLETLDDMVFFNNYDLTKLSLAGNVFEKVSPHVFFPTSQLTELDLSDCDLKQIWSDEPKQNMLPSLRSLNISNNEMKTLYLSEISFMSSLAVLDMSENPLKCETDFMEVISWLGKRKVLPGNSNVDQGTHSALKRLLTGSMPMPNAQHSWQSFTYKVCSDYRKADAKDADGAEATVVDPDDNKASQSSELMEDYESEYDSYYDDLDKVDDHPHVHNSKKEAKKVAESSKEEQLGAGGDGGDIFRTELNLIETIRGGLGDSGVTKTNIDLDDDSNESDIDEEEYQDGSKEEADDGFGWLESEPKSFFIRNASLLHTLAILFTVLFVFLLLLRLVLRVMHKRHERYRQAILASKNSFVYQKLSEDIGASTGKLPTIPKVHRYQPINQV